MSNVLDLLKKEDSLTGYRETDLEIVFLRLRHWLELIMFASVVAHQSLGHKLSKKIVEKEYSASRLFKFIQLANPKFHPKPVKSSEEKMKTTCLWSRMSLKDI